MPEVVLAAARFGFLVLLWLFVAVVVSVIRRDLFGAKAGVVAAPRGIGRAQQKQTKKARGKAPSLLIVTAGALAGTRITLGDAQVTMGRAEDSTLVLNDDYASTRHARLVPRPDAWYIEDLGSTNGTYLDRAKVDRPLPVPLGVPVRIGRTAFELRA